MNKIKRPLITTVFIAIVLNLTYSQEPNFEWVSSMGGSSYDVGNAIDTDSDGNVYLVGTFKGTVDFDPGPDTFNLVSAGGGDVFVQKLNSSGNFVWAVRLGSSNSDIFDYGISIAVDDSSNVYVTGNFSGTVDFDPGPDVFYLTDDAQDWDIFILKLDAAGNFIWAQKVPEEGSSSYWAALVKSITIDNSGNVYITGTIEYGNGGDILIQKRNSNGDLIWSKRIPPKGLGREIRVDHLGNIYIIGLFYTTTDFDPGPGIQNLTSLGSWDIFILKLNNSGNFVWVRQIGGGSGDGSFTSLTIDLMGDIYVTGSFIGIVDVDPGPDTLNFNSDGGNNTFAQKLDAFGNLIWAKQLAGEVSSSYVDLSGDMFTIGEFQATRDFDPGPDSLLLTSAGGFDIFIQKMDVNGDLLWVKQIGGTGSEGGEAITVDAVGSIYSSGYFTDTVDFDPGIDTFNLSEVGNGDIFVLKFAISTLDINRLDKDIEVLVYPNPTTDLLQIDKGISPDLIIHIFDTTGRLMVSNILQDNLSSLDISAFPSGLYVLVIRNRENRITRKIIKQ